MAEEVEETAEQQPLLGQGIRTQDGHEQGPDGAVEGEEQGVGIGIPEHVVIEHAGEGLKLDILGEEDDLAIIHRVTAADGGGDRVNEGIQAGKGEHAQQRIADDLEDHFGGFKLSFHSPSPP